jgi:hypothetical protein
VSRGRQPNLHLQFRGGVLFNLGHDIARNTVKAIVKERGIEPAKERGFAP